MLLSLTYLDRGGNLKSSTKSTIHMSSLAVVTFIVCWQQNIAYLVCSFFAWNMKATMTRNLYRNLVQYALLALFVRET